MGEQTDTTRRQVPEPTRARDRQRRRSPVGVDRRVGASNASTDVERDATVARDARTTTTTTEGTRETKRKFDDALGDAREMTNDE